MSTTAPQIVQTPRKSELVGKRTPLQRLGQGWLGLALEILVPISLLCLWELVTTQFVRSFYFPPLHKILSTFWQLWIFDHTKADLVPSLSRLLVGYAIAVLVGVGVGTFLGIAQRTRNAVAPIVEFLRSIPPPALLPIAIVLIGTGSSMKVSLIAFVALWPVLLNTVDGIASVDQGLLDTATVFRITGLERLRKVLLPSAGPQIFAGMRTSLSLAVILMVISEMVASTNGLGYFVRNSERSFAIPEMWSGIIVLGILGYVLNLVLLLIERRVLRWHREFKSAEAK